MSYRLRFGYAAFLFVAGFSTPAASDPLTDLFSRNAAPEAATAAPAPASAQGACLPQPGRSTAAGQHWVYRYDGHRKCWFQAEAGRALARKPVRQRVAAPEENGSAPRKEEAVEDAHAEMPSSTPTQASQATPPAPEIKLVKVVPVRIAGAAALVPPAPALAKPAADQVTSNQPTLPRQVNVETLLADAPAASDEVAAAPLATPVAVAGAMTGGGGAWTTNWLGVLLMALGFVALLSASRTLRRALWPGRFRKSRTEFSAIAHDGRNGLSFGRSA